METKAKINKQDLTKLQFLHSKGNHKQEEKTIYRMGENSCKQYDWQGTHFQHTQKQLISFNIKKTNNPVKKWIEDLNRHVSKEDIQMANRHEKMFNITNIRKMQIKTAMRYHLTLFRMAIMKKSKVINAGEGVEEKGTLLLVGKQIGIATMEKSMEVP